MPHPYFSRVALGLSLFPAMFGLGMLTRPNSMLESLGFPIPTDPEAARVTHNTMRFIGARNFAVTYLLILIWYKGDDKLTAKSLVALIGMAIADGFINIAQTGGGHWNHWGFLPITGGVAAGLQGWFN